MATATPAEGTRRILDALGLDYGDPIRHAAEDFAERSIDEKMLYLFVSYSRMSTALKTRGWLDLSARSVAAIGLVAVGGVLQQSGTWGQVIHAILGGS